MWEVLYILLCVVLAIGAAYVHKDRVNTERQYWKMKYAFDAEKQKEAQKQANHSRYGN